MNWQMINGRSDIMPHNIALGNDKYYDTTTDIVTKQLRKWLGQVKTVEKQIHTWERWIAIWSQFTLEGFLESSWDVIRAKLKDFTSDGGPDPLEDLGLLKRLLPWHEDAVRGYATFSYTQQLDQSLVQYLRDQLGGWWSPDMHALKGGMESLPKAFANTEPRAGKPLKDSIETGCQVYRIAYSFDKMKSGVYDRVTVSYYKTSDKETRKHQYTSRAVIVTTPVNILRQITFECTSGDGVPPDFYKAIENIFTGPSTKLFVQTKKRFWETSGIKGGFSRTNLPIGQMHYVSPEEVDGKCTDKGLLLIYTWKNEALLFGSMEQDMALNEAVEQIETIHKEIKYDDVGYDGVGKMHAWYSQPATQGAYGLLKPKQYNNIRYLWYPMNNVHFAGETYSFAAGWIQGALESGLRAAYQVYERQHRVLVTPN